MNTDMQIARMCTTDNEIVSAITTAREEGRKAGLVEAAARAAQFADLNRQAQALTSYLKGRADAGDAIAAAILALNAQGTGAMTIASGSYVRKTSGAGFEGEVRTVYTSRKDVRMAVVEIVGGPFAGMQHIYRMDQLESAEPSEWFNRWQKDFAK